MNSKVGSNTLITCSSLYVNYGNYQALKDISFTVEAGDYISIVGVNGGGKSTLLKTLLGLMKAANGEITFNNPPSAPKIKIGYLSQGHTFKSIIPVTAREVIASGSIKEKKESKARVKERIKEASILLKINNELDKSFFSLSGGQRQRILLARALVALQAPITEESANPPSSPPPRSILILDEPATGLDPSISEEFYSLIDTLNKKHKITVLIVSHDIERAMHYSTKILELNKSLLFYGEATKYADTTFYTNLRQVAVCSTHINSSCPSSCPASHLNIKE